MRDKPSCTMHALFRIVAVNGILLLLPSAAHAAAASEPPSDGAAVMPGAVADVAVDLGCALPEVAAAASSQCQNQDGTERGCTPSEGLRMCVDDAVDAVEQCIEGARGFLGRIGCEVGYAIDLAGCAGEVLGEVVEPIRNALK